MKIIKQLFCKHHFTWHGWSYILCKKCEVKRYNPSENERIQNEFWNKRIIDNNPVFSREAINKQLQKWGRSI